MARDPRPRLHDILRSIEWIKQDTKGATWKSFADDRRARQLVERNIEIISEASRYIPASLRKDFPEIPWKAIAGIGNVMRHDYDEIASSVLWGVIRANLDPLRRAVRKMLERLDAGEN